MTLSVLGLVTTTAVCSFVLRVYPHMQRALVRVPKSPPPGTSSPPEPYFHTPAKISNQFWLTNMVPIGAAQGITFACGNAAYMYLTITFTQAHRHDAPSRRDEGSIPPSPPSSFADALRLHADRHTRPPLRDRRRGAHHPAQTCLGLPV